MSTQPAHVNKVRIVVNGAAGRMGARLCALALDDPALALVGAVEQPGSRTIGAIAVPGAEARSPRVSPLSGFSRDFRAHVVIDFSSDQGALHAMELARSLHAALLVGTTALSPATIDTLRTASRERAVLVSPNTSRGVAVAAALVRSASRLLGQGLECSIVEAHHKAKKDAPSGTALRLADAARSGGAAIDNAQVVSIRGGDVIGEHTVRFAGQGEYLEITHRATSRDLFARGALDAAKWLATRPPGWWTMNDVLGLSAD